MGCHAAINGLRIADAIVRASSTRVLLCAVELCSLHFQYAPEPGQAVANALFADGAAAAVLGPGADAPLRIDSFSSRLIPGTASDMTWTIGDHGFRMTLSPRVPELLRAHASPWVADWLAARSLSTSDIDAWAVHPGGPRILDAVASSLALPSTALAVSRATLADHGNMSSPTILFILDRLRREPRRGRTLAMAFGPGLMAEGVLLG
jgi:predicted naringenin-chalcone synthase